MYTVSHIVYKVPKSLDVTTIGSHYFLQAGLETGPSLGNGIPVYIDHGILDGCLESLLVIVGSAIHSTLQNAPHKIIRGLQSGDEGGHKSGGGQW